MAMFQLLLGRHIDRDPRVKQHDGESSESFDQRSLREYWWNNPERNVVESEEDLEKKFNIGGCEKFRRINEFVVAKPDELSDDQLLKEAVSRGLMSQAKAEQLRAERAQSGGTPAKLDSHGTTADTAGPHTTNPSLPKPPLDPSATLSPQEQQQRRNQTVANLGKMDQKGLESFAADEEIDLSGCKDDNQRRAAIKKHFGVK